MSSSNIPAASNGAGQNGGPPPSIIADIRAVLVENPKLAEELARADQEQFPNGPHADERDALLVAAIFNQHRLMEARREARNYLRRHPRGRYAEQLMQRTGAVMPVSTASP